MTTFIHSGAFSEQEQDHPPGPPSLRSLLTAEVQTQQGSSPRGKLHTVLISLQVFYSKKHVLCTLSWVSKGTSMVKTITREDMLWFSLQTRMKKCLVSTHDNLKKPVFTILELLHPRSCDELCGEKQPEAQEVLPSPMLAFQKNVPRSTNWSQVQFLQLLIRQKENDIPRTKAQPIWPKTFI